MAIHMKFLPGNKPQPGLAPDGWDLDGEHPSVILRDVASRPRHSGHMIVFANEKGGVGKSTVAFHVAIALSDAGKKVACIDLDYAQGTLSRVLTNREATCRLLKTWLPMPRHVALSHQSGAYLRQEIARIGSDCDYIVLDLAGSDTPIARRAIAMADTLVTPVNCSFADLDLLGQFDAHNLRLTRLGHFSRLVRGLGAAREELHIPAPDWLVLPNRYRRSGSNNEALARDALADLAKMAGFRLGQGLGDRVAYRELFLFGLTHFDLKRIPRLAKVKAFARKEIEDLMTDLRLPKDDACQPSLFPLNDNAQGPPGSESLALPG